MATFDITKINTYTNPILKEECKKHQLKVGGNKKDLCERLKEFYSTSECEKEDKDVKELGKKMKKLQLSGRKQDKEVKEVEKKMKKLQVSGEDDDEQEARAIYPDISPSTIAVARKQGKNLVEWAHKLKKVRKYVEEYSHTSSQQNVPLSKLSMKWKY